MLEAKRRGAALFTFPAVEKWDVGTLSVLLEMQFRVTGVNGQGQLTLSRDPRLPVYNFDAITFYRKLSEAAPKHHKTNKGGYYYSSVFRV